MSESVVARLRKRIEYHALGLHPNYGPPSTLTHIECDTLSVLLDIVEAVAMWDFPPPDIEAGEGFCFYCGGEEHSHASDCPYRRARELCGKGDD